MESRKREPEYQLNPEAATEIENVIIDNATDTSTNEKWNTAEVSDIESRRF